MLDRGRPGPVFTEILLEVALETAGETGPQADALLRRAERDCIISRALACHVRLVVNGAGEPVAAASAG